VAGKFDELYDKYVKSEVVKEQFKADLDELLLATFEAYPTLRMIIFQGMTPAWQDGERCEHSEEIMLVCDDGLYDSGFASDYSFDSNEFTDKYGDKAESMIGKVLKFPGAETVYVELPVNVGPHPKKLPKMEKVKQILKAQLLTTLIHDTDYVLAITRTEEGYDSNVQECWDEY